MDRLEEVDRQLAAMERRRPLYPRVWKDEVDRRMAKSGRSIGEIVLQMREERDLIPPGPVTPSSLLEHERRFLALFEPDELLVDDELPTVGATAD